MTGSRIKGYHIQKSVGLADILLPMSLNSWNPGRLKLKIEDAMKKFIKKIIIPKITWICRWVHESQIDPDEFDEELSRKLDCLLFLTDGTKHE